MEWLQLDCQSPTEMSSCSCTSPWISVDGTIGSNLIIHGRRRADSSQNEFFKVARFSPESQTDDFRLSSRCSWFDSPVCPHGKLFYVSNVQWIQISCSWPGGTGFRIKRSWSASERIQSPILLGNTGLLVQANDRWTQCVLVPKSKGLYFSSCHRLLLLQNKQVENQKKIWRRREESVDQVTDDTAR